MKSAAFIFIFCIFLHENKTKSHDFNTFRKLKERATIVVSWEILPKKEGACPKRGTDTDRLQEITKIGHRLQTLLIGYKKDYKSRTWTTKLTDRLQKTTKVGLRLQSLLIDYKRLQKSDLDYKVS